MEHEDVAVQEAIRQAVKVARTAWEDEIAVERLALEERARAAEDRLEAVLEYNEAFRMTVEQVNLSQHLKEARLYIDGLKELVRQGEEAGHAGVSFATIKRFLAGPPPGLLQVRQK